MQCHIPFSQPHFSPKGFQGCSHFPHCSISSCWNHCLHAVLYCWSANRSKIKTVPLSHPETPHWLFLTWMTYCTSLVPGQLRSMRWCSEQAVLEESGILLSWLCCRGETLCRASCCWCHAWALLTAKWNHSEFPSLKQGKAELNCQGQAGGLLLLLFTYLPGPTGKICEGLLTVPIAEFIHYHYDPIPNSA